MSTDRKCNAGLVGDIACSWDGQDTADLILAILGATGENVAEVLVEAQRRHIAGNCDVCCGNGCRFGLHDEPTVVACAACGGSGRRQQ